ncbi:hypothetical protein [Archaeoglobus veneficus]|uniref:Putative transcriptional regulator protein n=1 Tax=Archaeoglobus veneficus (strain DSM 11195 / SNP6) TaxID=693661 RepID=F2KR49_ARCVS|nr:hypothetical protein [Archaeoglobus veneficus]AEA46686.1 putative transcriptional regulator protein [Archaeoglobus veneficus SNP6]
MPGVLLYKWPGGTISIIPVNSIQAIDVRSFELVIYTGDQSDFRMPLESNIDHEMLASSLAVIMAHLSDAKDVHDLNRLIESCKKED